METINISIHGNVTQMSCDIVNMSLQMQPHANVLHKIFILLYMAFILPHKAFILLYMAFILPYMVICIFVKQYIPGSIPQYLATMQLIILLNMEINIANLRLILLNIEAILLNLGKG